MIQRDRAGLAFLRSIFAGLCAWGFLGVLYLAPPAWSQACDVTLGVTDGDINPGGNVSLAVTLDNPVVVNGFSVDITEVPDELALDSCGTTARTQNFVCVCQQLASDQIRVLCVSLGGARIAAGVGDVVNIELTDESPSCQASTNIELQLSNADVADENNDPLVACFDDGTVSCVGLCGNGTIDSPEECDDGNTNPGDGCSDTCQIESTPQTQLDDFMCYKVRETRANICADGSPNEGEACDIEEDCGGISPTSRFCTGRGICRPNALSNAGGACEDEEDCGGVGTNLCVRNKFPKGIQVSLNDQFEEKDFDIKKPVSLCNPADKDGAGIVNSDVHLKGYLIKEVKTSCASGVNEGLACEVEEDCGGVTDVTELCGKTQKHEKEKGVLVDNQQFGTVVVDTIKPDRLLVPTAKDLASRVDPLTAGIDHFKCYRIRVNKRLCEDDPSIRCKADADCVAAGAAGPCNLGFPRDVQVNLNDQFNQPKLFDVKKATRLCTPVDKNSEGITDADTHLLCYQIKPTKGTCAATAPVNAGGACKKEDDCGGALCEQQLKHETVTQIFVNNQFGPEQLDTIKEEELCVPSTKTLP